MGNSYLKTAILTVLLFCFAMASKGQVVLSMDTFGKKKSKKFYVGETLSFKTFRMDSKDEYYSLKITRFDADEQIIWFDQLPIPVADITDIKVEKGRKMYKILGTQLLVFATSWTAYSFVSLFAGGPFVIGQLAVGGIAGLVGLLFLKGKFLWTKKYKINKKRRIRILDINPEKDDKAMIFKPQELQLV